jgi:hypothetical protein
MRAGLATPQAAHSHERQNRYIELLYRKALLPQLTALDTLVSLVYNKRAPQRRSTASTSNGCALAYLQSDLFFYSIGKGTVDYAL